MKPQSDFFSLIATDLMGNQLPGKTVRSNHFIFEARSVLWELKDNDKFCEAINDFGVMLKYIVKQELLAEMRKSVENIDTFYN